MQLILDNNIIKKKCINTVLIERPIANKKLKKKRGKT